jgi:hypothetical protein
MHHVDEVKPLKYVGTQKFTLPLIMLAGDLHKSKDMTRNEVASSTAY